MKFDENMKCVTVSGLADSVTIATKFVRTNYINVICMDKLEIVQPGDVSYHCLFLSRDVIYTSRAYATMSVSVCLSVCL